MLNFRGCVCVCIFMSAFVCVCASNFVFCLKDRAGGRETAAASCKARAERGGAEHLPWGASEKGRRGAGGVLLRQNITDREEDEEGTMMTGGQAMLEAHTQTCSNGTLYLSASGNATPPTPGSESPPPSPLHENPSHEAPPTEELRPKIGLSLKLGLCVTWTIFSSFCKQLTKALELMCNKFRFRETFLI